MASGARFLAKIFKRRDESDEMVSLIVRYQPGVGETFDSDSYTE